MRIDVNPDQISGYFRAHGKEVIRALENLRAIRTKFQSELQENQSKVLRSSEQISGKFVQVQSKLQNEFQGSFMKFRDALRNLGSSKQFSKQFRAPFSEIQREFQRNSKQTSRKCISNIREV